MCLQPCPQGDFSRQPSQGQRKPPRPDYKDPRHWLVEQNARMPAKKAGEGRLWEEP